MREGLPVVFGLFVGAFVVAILLGASYENLDNKRVERGWMENKGQVYKITPAEVK